MRRDIRDTQLYSDIAALHVAVRRPGSGQISDAAEAHVAPDGRQAVFSASLVDSLEASPFSRIASIDLLEGSTRMLTFGPNTDRLPRYSPNGHFVAFLSDRRRRGDFQLYLLDTANGGARATPQVDGWVEYLHWSPDGERILLGVAGHGADLAGVQGAIGSKIREEDRPSWMPTVEAGDESYRWRSIYVYELTNDRTSLVSTPGLNLWEAAWCGNAAVVAVVSSAPGEDSWYEGQLARIDIATRTSSTILAQRNSQQLGWPSASPSGETVAIVEALCSDRWIVAGDLRLIDVESGRLQEIGTQGVDVTHTEWRSESTLLIAGHRGFDIVVAIYELEAGVYQEIWSSRDISVGGRYVTVAGYGTAGDCAIVAESFTKAPEIGLIEQGQYRAVKSFDVGYAECAKAIAAVDAIEWKAADGLDIQGWLLQPTGKAPFPLLMEVHGGPVWHWRPRFLGRGGVHALALLQKGYAIFFPNPRGSSGRGQAFIRRVLGDVGGADTYDYLSGIDHLVAQGVADPSRLGVTGGSYGGFMSAWLITQDTRFAAAVPVAPIINHVTEELISNIPTFVRKFLDDRYTNPKGKYFARSPLMHAHKVKTPTLNVCGRLDRCTPPEEAMQFHTALRANGGNSVLVTYPEEGHGIRNWPAVIDLSARVVGWFETHMSNRAT